VSDGKLKWVWGGGYLPIKVSADPEKYSPKDFVTRISGMSLYPIALEEGLTGTGRTWVFDHAEVEGLMKEAWEGMNPEGDDILGGLRELPRVDGAAAKLPLTAETSNTAPPLSVSLHIPDAPLNFEKEKLPGNAARPCKLCGKNFKISAMRNHVGFHVLYSHRGVVDKF
jgi:hypothetical protein